MHLYLSSSSGCLSHSIPRPPDLHSGGIHTPYCRHNLPRHYGTQCLLQGEASHPLAQGQMHLPHFLRSLLNDPLHVCVFLLYLGRRREQSRTSGEFSTGERDF